MNFYFAFKLCAYPTIPSYGSRVYSEVLHSNKISGQNPALVHTNCNVGHVEKAHPAIDVLGDEIAVCSGY